MSEAYAPLTEIRRVFLVLVGLLLVAGLVSSIVGVKNQREAQCQRETEEAMRESQIFASSIVESAVNGIITIDERGCVESFNPAAEQLFGYRSDGSSPEFLASFWLYPLDVIEELTVEAGAPLPAR